MRSTMLILSLLAVHSHSSDAHAQGYYGYGSSTRVGNSTYHNFSSGLTGSSNRYGNSTYHNFSNGLSGTSNRIGNFTIHNNSNGVTGTSNRIGGTTYHSYSTPRRRYRYRSYGW